MINFSDRDIERIARACHEINAAYCRSIGDTSHKPWEETLESLKASTMLGVIHKLMNPDITPEDSHNLWLQTKLNEGYVYGSVKDHELKTHPCVLPYSALPLADRVKDHLFLAVVKTFSKEVINGTTNN